MRKSRLCIRRNGFSEMVPGAGIEPARLAAGDFESPASTNFTTWAGLAAYALELGAQRRRRLWPKIRRRASRLPRTFTLCPSCRSNRAGKPFECLLSEVAVEHHRDVA